MKDDLKHIIESLLFVSDVPLSVRRIVQILDLRNSDVVREILHELGREYEKRKGGFYLKEIAGGYQLRSRPEHREWIRRMLQSKPARLSKAAMETLAIIAYKQPIIRTDIEHIRGVDCGGVLRMMMERKLIRVMGRKEIPGRPMIYGTTREFLEIFNLKDLKDLPSLKEIESLSEGLSRQMELEADAPPDMEISAGMPPGDLPANGADTAVSADESGESGAEAAGLSQTENSGETPGSENSQPEGAVSEETDLPGNVPVGEDAAPVSGDPAEDGEGEEIHTPDHKNEDNEENA
ncbi:SMC-Scp complex subunit ScpB [Desulfonema ishimotonii]|uniref:SMC-Scp complex subunit ScpB n=1 Tax=Desulfonema ishimotonii TaxID=45657 RepID=A0A401FYD2_9BACT|nr:SMC-Scp complex subunit ScpB [Desulfonema ishimotonii]GBC61965.1 SMC-Scp complex subunit ScpB [Desulfonema ishimotonii]